MPHATWLILSSYPLSNIPEPPPTNTRINLYNTVCGMWQTGPSKIKRKCTSCLEIQDSRQAMQHRRLWLTMGLLRLLQQGSDGGICSSHVKPGKVACWDSSEQSGTPKGFVWGHLWLKHLLSSIESLPGLSNIPRDVWLGTSHWQWFPHNSLPRPSRRTSAHERFQVGCCATQSRCTYR